MPLEMCVPGALFMTNIQGIAYIQIETNGSFICKNFKILKHVMAFSKSGDFFNIMNMGTEKKY